RKANSLWMEGNCKGHGLSVLQAEKLLRWVSCCGTLHSFAHKSAELRKPRPIPLETRPNRLRLTPVEPLHLAPLLKPITGSCRVELLLGNIVIQVFPMRLLRRSLIGT